MRDDGAGVVGISVDWDGVAGYMGVVLGGMYMIGVEDEDTIESVDSTSVFVVGASDVALVALGMGVGVVGRDEVVGHAWVAVVAFEVVDAAVSTIVS